MLTGRSTALGVVAPLTFAVLIVVQVVVGSRALDALLGAIIWTSMILVLVVQAAKRSRRPRPRFALLALGLLAFVCFLSLSLSDLTNWGWLNSLASPASAALRLTGCFLLILVLILNRRQAVR